MKKISEPAENLYKELKKQFTNIDYDESGSIGKRYRRQDEIGTPVCFTIDFQTLEDQTITARMRDTGAQERIKISDAASYLSKIIG